MKPKFLTLGMISGALLLSGACSEQAEIHTETHAEHSHKVGADGVIRTVKPGAEVTFSHSLRSPARIGARASLDLVIEDQYTDGQLQLVAFSEDDRIEIFGPSSEAVKSLRGDRANEWSVLFTPKEEGIHYISVQATVIKDGKPQSARAYSARIEVGDITDALLEAERDVGIQVRSDGRRVKILPASEPNDE